MTNPQVLDEAGAPAEDGVIEWSAGDVSLAISHRADDVPHLSSLSVRGVEVALPAGLPLVDFLSVGRGHTPASDRLVHASAFPGLRLIEAVAGESDGGARLEVRCRTTSGLEPVELALHLEVLGGSAVIRSSVRITNLGAAPLVLRALPSWASYLGAGSVARGWWLAHARSDWLAENRWVTEPLDAGVLPGIASELTGHNPRGSVTFSSDGTWSTGRHLPAAFVGSKEEGICWGFQIEHNGAWRWEIGEDHADLFLALSGPTDSDHQFVHVLEPGGQFTSVPVAVTLAGTLTDAADLLTDYRRIARRERADNASLPVIFNDYMNTLNGDPSTEKLLPLIDAAAEVGAEIFCIDAGWYDDGGDWWDSVGSWQPSSTRFPGGLTEVTDRIRSRGMAVGLWLEPEVIGVKSAAAATLPDEAFQSRAGARIVEHERYLLDLRHPAARAHLDEVVDRLVTEFDTRYFKFDYNVTPGAGTDTDAASPGAALLEHNRAHLEWLDGVLDRHPDVVIENCASGGMRSDFAMLSRLQLQSTSDQQEPRLYPPIAASAPLGMLPEQAASWAYPQPEMTLEQSAFALTTGLLGRYFVSGFLNRMDDDRRALVGEAITAAKGLTGHIRTSHARYPLGFPGWDDPCIALGLLAGDRLVVSVWDRQGSSEIHLHLPDLHDAATISTEAVFPVSLPDWPTRWDPATQTLTVRNPGAEPGARTFGIDLPKPQPQG